MTTWYHITTFELSNCEMKWRATEVYISDGSVRNLNQSISSLSTLLCKNLFCKNKVPTRDRWRGDNSDWSLQDVFNDVSKYIRISTNNLDFSPSYWIILTVGLSVYTKEDQRIDRDTLFSGVYQNFLFIFGDLSHFFTVPSNTVSFPIYKHPFLSQLFNKPTSTSATRRSPPVIVQV